MNNLKEHIITHTSNTYFYNKKYMLPRKCPHCAHSISVTILDVNFYKYTPTQEYNFLIHQCPECLKSFFTIHLRNTKDDTNDFTYCYPSHKLKEHSEIIENFSPRFVEVYNQAFTAEQMNHYALAGTGYRIALEILIKDFAIKENPEDKGKIEGFTLNNCIQNYYKDLESIVSAHVVRQLGNDYAHYIQTFENVDFTEIKYYLDVFVSNIEMRLKIKNPPVPVSSINQSK